MKRFLVILATVLCTLSASAFEFDGIDLNGTITTITREISRRGYVYDESQKALVGLCHGTEIMLTLNYDDVTEKGHLGQLHVDVPSNSASFFNNAVMLLNVIYHQVLNTEEYVYAVDNQGTTLVVYKTDKGIRLTYNTVYYKEKK